MPRSRGDGALVRPVSSVRFRLLAPFLPQQHQWGCAPFVPGRWRVRSPRVAPWVHTQGGPHDPHPSSREDGVVYLVRGPTPALRGVRRHPGIRGTPGPRRGGVWISGGPATGGSLGSARSPGPATLPIREKEVTWWTRLPQPHSWNCFARGIYPQSGPFLRSCERGQGALPLPPGPWMGSQ